MCFCVRMWAWACACEGQWLMLDIFLKCSPSYYFFICAWFFFCVCMCYNLCVEVRGQLSGIGSYLPLCWDESLLLFLLMHRLLHASWSWTASKVSCLHLPSYHRNAEATDAHHCIHLFTWVPGTTLRLSSWRASHLYVLSIFKKEFLIEPGYHLFG